MLIFNALLPVFLIILLGWALRAYNIVPEKEWRGIQLLGYWILFPSLLIDSIASADFSALEINNLLIAYLVAIAIILALSLALYPLRSLFNLSGPEFSSVFQTSTRWNAFIALAIVDKYLGAVGLALVAAIMAVSVPILNITNVLVVAYTAANKRPTLRQALVTTLKNPFLIGCLIGLAINLLQIPIYGPIDSALDLLARGGLGVGLLTVGAGLRLRMLKRPQLKMFIGTVNKVIFFPLIVYVCCLVFNVTGIERVVAVLCASVPTAMNGYVLARELGGDTELYALSAALQTVLSFFSIPYFVWLASF